MRERVPLLVADLQRCATRTRAPRASRVPAPSRRVRLFFGSAKNARKRSFFFHFFDASLAPRDSLPPTGPSLSPARLAPADVEASISLNAQEDEWFQVHRTTWLERLKFLKFGSARVLDRVARVVIHPEDEEAAEDAYKTPWYLHWALCVYGVQILMLYGSVKSIGWKPLEHCGWTDAEASDWVNRVTELVDVPTDRPPQLCRSVIEVSAVDAMNTLARAC